MTGKKNFADKLAAKSNPRTMVSAAQTPKPKETAAAAKSKGRPLKDEAKGKKRDYCKTINIAVPKEVLEEVTGLATAARGINLTDYVNQTPLQTVATPQSTDKYHNPSVILGASLSRRFYHYLVPQFGQHS